VEVARASNFGTLSKSRRDADSPIRDVAQVPRSVSVHDSDHCSTDPQSNNHIPSRTLFHMAKSLLGTLHILFRCRHADPLEPRVSVFFTWAMGLGGCGVGHHYCLQFDYFCGIPRSEYGGGMGKEPRGISAKVPLFMMVDY
jgi:hypothetical protein